jgi:hypothetical protein
MLSTENPITAEDLSCEARQELICLWEQREWFSGDVQYLRYRLARAEADLEWSTAAWSWLVPRATGASSWAAGPPLLGVRGRKLLPPISLTSPASRLYLWLLHRARPGGGDDTV